MDAQELRNLSEAYMEVYQELDEAEKVFPYGKVGDKLRSLHKRKQGAKTPKEQNKIAGRIEKINKEYNVPMEQVDLYDIILSHLLDEGYAETIESAEAIMVNMSEEWREDIIEAKSDEGLSRDEKEQVRSERQGGRDRISRKWRNDFMRGKKREKGVKSTYDSLGNMTRTRYRQQQFKRTGNPLYKDD
jgi:hypothetical protein